jgi:NTE family protein
MLYFTASAPIRNNSFDTVNVMQDLLQADRAASQKAQEERELVNRYDPKTAATMPAPAGYEPYFISLNFNDVQDPALRKRLQNMASRLSLPPDQVDDLRKAAGELLRQSPDFQRLMRDLEKDDPQK